MVKIVIFFFFSGSISFVGLRNIIFFFNQKKKITKHVFKFLLKNTGGKYSLAYAGAIDDNPQVEKDAKQNYLKNAIK